MRKYIWPALLLAACADGPPHTPETRPVDHPNAGNTAIYDVDADDPYEMSEAGFLDLHPGMPLPATENLLPVAAENTGEGTPHRYLLLGRRRDTLGYVLVEPAEQTIISIHVTSTDVVTRDGLRVGNSYAELRERLGAPADLATIDGHPLFRTKEGLSFRLSPATSTAADDARVTEIIIRQP